MAETGCLKDGHFNNLEVEGATSDLGTGTLKYQSADLPLITMIGKSFTARVSASLLNSLGISELITNTEQKSSKKQWLEQ